MSRHWRSVFISTLVAIAMSVALCGCATSTDAAQPDETEQTLSDEVQGERVTLRLGVPASEVEPELAPVYVTPEPVDRADVCRMFLGESAGETEHLATGGDVVRGDDGLVLFSADGGYEYQIGSDPATQPVPFGYDEAFAMAEEFVTSRGLMPKDAVAYRAHAIDEESDDPVYAYGIEFVQEIDGTRVAGRTANRIRVLIGSSGVQSYEHRWASVDDKGQKVPLISARQAAMRLADNGIPGAELETAANVTGLSLIYHSTPARPDSYLPAWEIELEKSMCYYVDAQTGEIIE